MATLPQLFGGTQENHHGSQEGYGPEQGTDLNNLSAGTPVRLPEDAFYQPGDSSNYQSVFQSARTGYGLSFTHIDALQFAQNALVKAGTVIGTISSRVGWPVPGVSPAFGGNYYSSGPHLEVGVYTSPQAAAQWQYNQSVDPVSYYGGDNVALARSTQNTAPQPVNPANSNNPNPGNQMWFGVNNNTPILGGLFETLNPGDPRIAGFAPAWVQTPDQPGGLAGLFPGLSGLGQTSADFSASLDKVVKWIPAIVIIMVIAWSIGKAKHG